MSSLAAMYTHDYHTITEDINLLISLLPPPSPTPPPLEGPSPSISHASYSGRPIQLFTKRRSAKDSPSNLFDFRLSMLNTFPIIFHCHHYFLCLLFLLLLLCIAFVVAVEAPGGVSAGQAYITTKWFFLFCIVFNYLSFSYTYIQHRQSF